MFVGHRISMDEIRVQPVGTGVGFLLLCRFWDGIQGLSYKHFYTLSYLDRQYICVLWMYKCVCLNTHTHTQDRLSGLKLYIPG